jgi:hypothetical protein
MPEECTAMALTILPARIPIHCGSVLAKYGRGRPVSLDIGADIKQRTVHFGVYDLEPDGIRDTIRRFFAALDILGMPDLNAPEPLTAAAVSRVAALCDRLAELRNYLDTGDCTASADYAAGALAILDIVHTDLGGLASELRRLGGDHHEPT